jgi:hypothetical protein
MSKYTLILDSDTPIIRAAAVCQNNVKVVHVPTGSFDYFPSRKQFFEKSKGINPDEYEFYDEPALIDLGPDADIRWRGYKGVKDWVEKHTSMPWVKDFKLVVGGQGNFRDAVAVTWPYKGNRGEKPILSGEMKEYMLKRWPDKIIQMDGIEADDVLGHYGWASYEVAKRLGDPKKAPCVIGHVDKDINMIPGWHYNFTSGEIYWVSETDGLKFFFKQMLYGDKQVDFVPGLNSMSKEISDKFKVRNTKSMGEKTAEAIINTCTTVRDALEATVFCYKTCYPDTWQEYIQEQSDLLWMQREPGSRYVFEEAIEAYGISV